MTLLGHKYFKMFKKMTQLPCCWPEAMILVCKSMAWSWNLDAIRENVYVTEHSKKKQGRIGWSFFLKNWRNTIKHEKFIEDKGSKNFTNVFDLKSYFVHIIEDSMHGWWTGTSRVEFAANCIAKSSDLPLCWLLFFFSIALVYIQCLPLVPV